MYMCTFSLKNIYLYFVKQQHYHLSVEINVSSYLLFCCLHISRQQLSAAAVRSQGILYTVLTFNHKKLWL